MKRLILSAALALSLVAHSAAIQAPSPVKRVVSGKAYIVDGDTLRIGKTKVRFDGVAAAERHTADGKAATAHLKSLTVGKTVVCRLTGAKSYKRHIGTCFVGNINLLEQMTLDGFSRDCPRYSNGRYAHAEAKAQRNGHDLSRTYKLPKYCVER